MRSVLNLMLTFCKNLKLESKALKSGEYFHDDNVVT